MLCAKSGCNRLTGSEEDEIVKILHAGEQTDDRRSEKPTGTFI